MEQGVDVITLGNHAFHNKDILEYIGDAENIVRPYNFSEDSPGKGYVTMHCKGLKITVFQVIGKVFMNSEHGNPFKAAKKILENVESEFIFAISMGKRPAKKLLSRLPLTVRSRLFLEPIPMFRPTMPAFWKTGRLTLPMSV